MCTIGRISIGAQVALLFQHNANAKCQRVYACTRSMPCFAIFIKKILHNVKLNLLSSLKYGGNINIYDFTRVHVANSTVNRLRTKQRGPIKYWFLSTSY